MYKILLVGFLINTCVGPSHCRSKTVSILHLSVDGTRQGEPNHPGLFTRANVTTAFVIDFWTDNKRYRRRYERVSFATFNMNSGTITIRENGEYMIYVSMTFYKKMWSASQYMVVADDKTIMKCVRTVTISALVGGIQRRMVKCQIQDIFPLFDGQVISIKSGNNGQRILANSDATYWGIIQL